MLTTFYALALLLLAVTLGLSLAHALEFPGKLRLDEPTYRAVQAIYYPGFTIGGLIGEFGGMVLLAVLLVVTPEASARFWWAAVALGSLLACHAIYWIVTHPVNAAWLQSKQLTGLGRLFFGLFAAPDADWKQMRNVWEWSHVARTSFAAVSFIAMTVAIIC